MTVLLTVVDGDGRVALAGGEEFWPWPPRSRADRRRSLHALQTAIADALAPGGTELAGEVSVRSATLDDAPALARIQWEGALMAGGTGRGYRRYERFEPALAAWLAQALASEQGDVLVEVADGEVVAWMALDKSLDPAHPRGSGPPWPGPPPRRR